MHPRVIFSIVFEYCHTSIGRIFVGLVLAICIMSVGVIGLLSGTVWVPSSKPMAAHGMYFGGPAGIAASLAYVFLGLLVHYLGYWKRGNREDTKTDTVALSLLVLVSLAVTGFVLFVLFHD